MESSECLTCEADALADSPYCAAHKPSPRKGMGGGFREGNQCSRTATTTGERCRRPAIKGGTMCQKHTTLPQVKAAAVRNAARQDVAKLVAAAAASGVEPPLPMPVKPADFAKVAAEYVGRFNRLFARLENDLDMVRAVGTTELELARLYGDILDRQATSAVLVTKMMNAAAALGINMQPDQPVAPPLERMLQLLADVQTRRAQAAEDAAHRLHAVAGVISLDADDDEDDDESPQAVTCYPAFGNAGLDDVSA